MEGTVEVMGGSVVAGLGGLRMGMIRGFLALFFFGKGKDVLELVFRARECFWSLGSDVRNYRLFMNQGFFHLVELLCEFLTSLFFLKDI